MTIAHAKALVAQKEKKILVEDALARLGTSVALQVADVVVVQHHIASTSTPTTQQVALTPLMQINTTHKMTRLNTGLNTPTHMPKLRIPPLPHQPRNPLPHSLNSQQNNSRTQAYLTSAHKHNTPTNRSVNNISPQVTHNIQSQIQNFLNHKAPKHKK